MRVGGMSYPVAGAAEPQAVSAAGARRYLCRRRSPHTAASDGSGAEKTDGEVPLARATAEQQLAQKQPDILNSPE